LEFLPASFANRKTFGRRVLNRAVEYTPVTFLAATGASLLSFLPYAHALAEFRSSPSWPADDSHIAQALFGLAAIPIYISSPHGAVVIWYGVTLALSALAVLMIARNPQG
jgi:hypothetical protein